MGLTRNPEIGNAPLPPLSFVQYHETGASKEYQISHERL